jgi:sugar/nucleoside kinase (ribokinase family)
VSGLYNGYSEERCMTIANAAGALCTTRLSHNGVESLDAVMELIRGRAGMQDKLG